MKDLQGQGFIQIGALVRKEVRARECSAKGVVEDGVEGGIEGMWKRGRQWGRISTREKEKISTKEKQ